ncbi:MAG: hypothetical protein ABJN69_05380 [Hellea sp.]
MTKTLKAEYKGRHIVVQNNWLGGCKIFVDDAMIHHDKRYVHLDRDLPFFEFDLKTQDGVEPAAVFVEAILDVKLLLQISGKTVARTDATTRVVA